MSNPLEGQQEAVTDSSISPEKLSAIEDALNEIDSAILHLRAGGLTREQEDNLNRRVAELIETHDLKNGVNDPRTAGLSEPLQPGDIFVSEKDMPLLRQIQQKDAEKSATRNKKVGVGVALAAVAAMASRLIPSPPDSVEAPQIVTSEEQANKQDQPKWDEKWLQELTPAEAGMMFGGPIKEWKMEREISEERSAMISELRNLIEHRAGPRDFEQYISRLQQNPRFKDGTLVVEAQIAALREDIETTFVGFPNHTPAEYQRAVQRLEQFERHLDMVNSNNIQLSLADTPVQEQLTEQTNELTNSNEHQLARLDAYLADAKKQIDASNQSIETSLELHRQWEEAQKNK